MRLLGALRRGLRVSEQSMMEYLLRIRLGRRRLRIRRPEAYADHAAAFFGLAENRTLDSTGVSGAR
jgi:hypothetical protein